MLLPGPYELIDLHDGGTMTLRVDNYLDGTMVIHPVHPNARHRAIHMEQKGLTTPPPEGTPISNEVEALRLYGTRLDEANRAGYWDVTSRTLRADLLARFQNGLSLPAVISLEAHGVKPRKRYSVTVLSS